MNPSEPFCCCTDGQPCWGCPKHGEYKPNTLDQVHADAVAAGIQIDQYDSERKAKPAWHESELARKQCRCIDAPGDNADCSLHVTTAEAINHPTHYNWFPIECADVTDNFNFNLGNVIKYCWRSGFKGSQLKDLRKAMTYLQREIDRVKE